jgi:2-C-methyl-D-erythritol 4-phosphate cytidylyltransferase
VVSVAAIVPAAGRGVRLGPGGPKALRLLGGTTLLVHAVRALQAATLVSEVVVAAPPDAVDVVIALVGPGTEVVAGGDERTDSVRASLAVLHPSVEVVLVHDAARPLAPPALIDDVASAVIAGAPAVVPGLPVVDTIKEVDSTGRVVRTPPRDILRAVQTPQGFRRDVLARAHEQLGATVTDDAGLVEALGEPVLVIPGAADAFKITSPADMLLAERVLAGRAR